MYNTLDDIIIIEKLPDVLVTEYTTMPSSRSDREFLKELKKKDKKRRKQKRRRRHSDSSSESSSEEDSDMDLQKELYPISHYANDREEMINQVFSVIKGNKLKSMLPPFLADLDVDEVKALCLEQVIVPRLSH